MKKTFCFFLSTLFLLSALNVSAKNLFRNKNIKIHSLDNADSLFSVKPAIILNTYGSIGAPVVKAIEPQMGVEFFLNQTFSFRFLVSYFYTYNDVVSSNPNDGSYYSSQNYYTANESGTTRLHLIGLIIQPKVRLSPTKERYISGGLIYYHPIIKKYNVSYIYAPISYTYNSNPQSNYIYSSVMDYSVKYNDGFSGFNLAYSWGTKFAKNRYAFFDVGIKSIGGTIHTSALTTQYYYYYNNPAQSKTTSSVYQSKKNFNAFLFYVGLTFVL